MTRLNRSFNWILMPTCTLLALLAIASPGAVAQTQPLDGVWTITTVVADGRAWDMPSIMQNYAADGRITISGQTFQIIAPATHQPYQMPIVVDGTTGPAGVTIGSATTGGGHGIILASGNVAVFCISSHDRPAATSLSSQPASGNLLMTLERVTATAPAAAPQPVAPAAVPPPSDEQLRTMLVGTWGHQDKDSTRMATLNADGSISVTTTSKEPLKKLFHPEVRSSGTWKVQEGVVIATITTSTDKDIRGQIYSYRIRTINDREMIAVDQNGQVRQEFKSP